MFNLKSMRKTKLTLALSAVLAGGLMSVPAHAVQLTEDGLGDAAIFQYFTAKGGWQTFIRLINTSNDAIVVKVRFREAANSRELRDFLVALSPNDMWSAWTDSDSLNGVPGALPDQPGIRTNDTSCIFDLPNTGPTTFRTVNGHLKAVAFSADAFTNSSGTDYSDQSTASTAARLAEGYIEVIGVASYGSNSDFARAVTHNQGTGVPENCSEGMNLFRNSPFIGTNAGFNVGNVLAANAQLISVDSGEGVGYDPVILANFQNGSLRQETLLRLNAGGSGHGQWPTLDSADPHSLMLTANGTAISSVWDVDQNGNSFFGSDDVAAQQLLANGALASMTVVAGDLNGDGDTQDTIASVVDTFGVQIGTNVSEANLPAGVLAALTATGKYSALVPGGLALTTVVTAGTPLSATVFSFVSSSATVLASAAAPVRLTNIAHENNGTADNAVRGGIDAVSAVLARRSVINEWAASPTPSGVIKDFYTQWVVTFPTKHYYVDLQDDPNADDRFAPTLVDPRDAPTDLNDAFAPFSFEFDTANGTGNAVGQSCESYDMVLWDREESMLGFSSPADYNPSRMCNEVNVLSFTDAYATKGLNSSFGSVVPEEKLPPNAMASSFTRAQRGWARMTFTGTGSNTGLTAASAYASAIPSLLAGLTSIDPSDNAALVRYQGLPVVGFALSSYITGSATTNHNTTNTHKYERDIEVVEPAVGGVNATNAAKDTGLVNGDDLDGDNVVQFNNGARDVNP